MPNQSEPFLVMKSVLRYTAAQVYIVSPDLWPMAAWSCDTRDQSCAIGCSRSAVQIHNTLTTATSTTYEPPIYMQRVLHTDTSKTKVCVKQFHSFALVPLIPVHPSILPCFFFLIVRHRKPVLGSASAGEAPSIRRVSGHRGACPVLVAAIDISLCLSVFSLIAWTESVILSDPLA